MIINSKIFTNNLEVSQVNLFEVQPKANEIMRDVVTKLLTDLSIHFLENKSAIN